MKLGKYPAVGIGQGEWKGKNRNEKRAPESHILKGKVLVDRDGDIFDYLRMPARVLTAESLSSSEVWR